MYAYPFYSVTHFNTRLSFTPLLCRPFCKKKKVKERKTWKHELLVSLYLHFSTLVRALQRIGSFFQSRCACCDVPLIPLQIGFRGGGLSTWPEQSFASLVPVFVSFRSRNQLEKYLVPLPAPLPFRRRQQFFCWIDFLRQGSPLIFNPCCKHSVHTVEIMRMTFFEED